jgi:hypothetical protein
MIASLVRRWINSIHQNSKRETIFLQPMAFKLGYIFVYYYFKHALFILRYTGDPSQKCTRVPFDSIILNVHHIGLKSRQVIFN